MRQEAWQFEFCCLDKLRGDDYFFVKKKEVFRNGPTQSRETKKDKDQS
jgi:hypothetical protein